VTKIDKLRQKLARQIRIDIFRELLAHEDEILNAARKDKSIKPSELRRLTEFVELLKATK
jgi:hypothetical protein